MDSEWLSTLVGEGVVVVAIVGIVAIALAFMRRDKP